MTENEIIKELESCYKTMSVYIGSSEECRKHNDTISKAIDAVKEIQQYRSIGTIEECREAMERQMEKKPIKDEYNHDCCPNCGWIVYQDEWGGRHLPHCENCGQAISWEESEGEDD